MLVSCAPMGWFGPKSWMMGWRRQSRCGASSMTICKSSSSLHKSREMRPRMIRSRPMMSASWSKNWPRLQRNIEAAASAATDAAPVTAPVPRLLQTHAERMARERDDPDGPSEASERAGRSRTAKTVRAALGVLTGVAAGVTVHAWAMTGPGAPLLSRMVALAEKLFALL